MADKTFMQRLIAARKQIFDTGIAKDKEGYQYKYIDLPQVEAKVIEACSANDILTWIDYTENKATILIYDALNPETLPFSLSVEPKDCNTGKTPIQGTGAMMTYMRRYLYMTAFCISEHDILDADQDRPEDRKSKTEEGFPVDSMDEIRLDILKQLKAINKDLPKKVLTMTRKDSFNDVPIEYLQKVLDKYTPSTAQNNG